MASLILDFQDLYERVAKYLGTYGSSGPSGANLTDAKDIVNDAYTKFITARCWSFMKPSDTIITQTNQYIYQLPELFSSMLTYFQYGEESAYPDIEEVSVDKIFSLRAVDNSTRYPDCYALRPQKHDNVLGQRWEVLFHPTPDASYTLHYRYKVLANKLENDDDIPIGGVEHAQLIRQMAIAEAELAQDKTTGPQTATAQQMLAQAMVEDSKRNPHRLGYNGGSHGDSAYEAARGSYRINDVTYTTD